MANIIINESQLHIIREFENQTNHHEFEYKVRDYLKELSENPISPKFDEYFKNHGITESDLQNKLLDLGLISKQENITEPEDANGKKRSVHTKSFKIYNKNFNDNIDKLFDEFIKGKTMIKEDGEGGFGGGALGGCNLMAGSSDESGGVAYPFGGKNKVVRKAGYNSQRKDGDITKQDSNVDMTPALARDRKHGISMNRKK